MLRAVELEKWRAAWSIRAFDSAIAPESSIARRCSLVVIPGDCAEERVLGFRHGEKSLWKIKRVRHWSKCRETG